MGRSGYAPTRPWLLLTDQGSSTSADLLHVTYGACVDGDGVVARANVEGAFVGLDLVVALAAVDVAGRASLEVSLWTQKSDSLVAYFGP